MVNLKARAMDLLAWSLFLGVYLLFSGSADVSEVVAGALSASIVLLLVVKLRKSFTLPLHVKGAWLRLLWRIPPAMLQESWLLLIALVRALAGKEAGGVVIEHPYPETADAHDSARRAFMTLGVCITPNSYLVYEDREKGTVLVRQLVGKELSPVDRLFLELT